MALNQNQFTISTVKGTIDSGNSLTCQFYDADPAMTIEAGEFVKLSSVAAANAPAVTVVQKGADRAAKYFGVVVTNPLKAAWVSGDKLEVSILNTVVMVEAATAIPAGTSLGYDPAQKQVIGAGPGETVVGVALESATSSGQLIRALINTNF